MSCRIQAERPRPCAYARFAERQAGDLTRTWRLRAALGDTGIRANGSASIRVVMVSKALVVGAYQRKAEEIARLGVDLTVLIPPAGATAAGARNSTGAHARLHAEG